LSMSFFFGLAKAAWSLAIKFDVITKDIAEKAIIISIILNVVRAILLYDFELFGHYKRVL
jgi:hypothetical protein